MFSVLAVRTPTLPPATHTNCYRLGDTVVDPASPEPEEQVRLAAWAGPIRRIVLTHAHGDHVGGVLDLAARTGAGIYAHADAPVPFPLTGTLADGERIDTGAGTLVAWHTPGHADGHLVFQIEGTGEVICGDLVAGEGTIVLVPPEGSLAAYLASLARVRAFATTLWPAHGGPQPAALADHYVAHRHRRTEQFLAVLREGGPASPAAIAAAVYAGVPGANLQIAAMQVLTHLDWLHAHGRVRPQGDAWMLT